MATQQQTDCVVSYRLSEIVEQSSVRQTTKFLLQARVNINEHITR